MLGYSLSLALPNGGGKPTPAAAAGTFDYLRPDGVSGYFQPDGSSTYLQP